MNRACYIWHAGKQDCTARACSRQGALRSWLTALCSCPSAVRPMPPLSPLHIYSPNPADSGLGGHSSCPHALEWAMGDTSGSIRYRGHSLNASPGCYQPCDPGQVTSPAGARSSLSTKQIRTMAPSRLFRRIPCANKACSHFKHSAQ